MNRSCEMCDATFEDENSDSSEPQRFCSEDCQMLMNTCKQCFEEYIGEKGDGFCSDSCSKRYDLECYGPPVPVVDPNAHECCCLDCCDFPELH